MCGIAGSYTPGDLGTDPWVEEALGRIAHRGPDGTHVLATDEITHGHVRLAIMDPEPRSDCPFLYANTLLSYNGECWNFAELRAELEGKGRTFRTTGDTEVVAAMLEEYGPAALDQLEGQYALAWTNVSTGETWLARDRFGEVPLYVMEGEADLFGPAWVRWASERKAFRGEDRVSPGAAFSVPAGSVWKVGESGPEFYYHAAWAKRRQSPPADAAEVRRILERAVERRLHSDVPVCTLLSGGVDSSSILALAREHQPDIVAYTIVFREDAEDLQQARAVADHFGVELREVPVPLPDDDLLREAIDSIEITMKAQIEIALHCLPLAERIYADGYRVVLSGEGADELFGGYGMLARRSKGDWPAVRLEGIEKMARGNFVRINKVFMAHGVEARTPFMDRELVEAVLPLTRDECPEQKMLLREAVTGLVPEETRTRKKVSFQSGSGMRAHLADALEDKQQIKYNQIARELFGDLPRG